MPIVHFSVDWWRSLHQPATITRFNPTIDGIELFTLMLGMVVFLVVYVWLMIHRFRLQWSRRASTTEGWTWRWRNAAPRRRPRSRRAADAGHDPRGRPWAYVVAAYAIVIGTLLAYVVRTSLSVDGPDAAFLLRSGGWMLAAGGPPSGSARLGVDEPDDRDLDDGGLDLTPRNLEAGRPARPAASGAPSSCS